ncbi:MAG: DEAD/DEAH box helicase [Turicibacter sp.]
MFDCYGREWLENEIIKYKNQLSLESSSCVLVVGIAQKPNNKWMCQRCLNEKKSRFGSFKFNNESITYCRECLAFGMVSNQMTLTRSTKRPLINEMASVLNADFKLSHLQQQASKSALQTLASGGAKMIWAVCGAGKTEMMFETISQALSENKRVCWAIPRTDVVIELVPRLKRAFPHASVVGLHGNSKEKTDYGDIVITTTHQLVRFYQAFELLIIDEVDAFPYTFDEMLPRVVKKACAPNCATIYLSATPSAKDIKDIKHGKLPCCIIPARYHLHALDIPLFKYAGNYSSVLKKGKLPQSFKLWLDKKINGNRRALLFVASIEAGRQLKEILLKQSISVEFVYASDENRAKKVQNFKEGTYQFLITTMILERGVTIVDIDVAIMGASDEVFEESALVQISGRVGRHPQYPHGEIIFFHHGVTLAMDKARNQLKNMNRKARIQGLLKD